MIDPIKRPAASKLPKAAAGDDENTIRVVAARTGLGMETLRAWERRYGFPRPERRPGSNRRLYSGDDLARLVAIRRVLERGFRVGDVIGKNMGQLEQLALPDRADVSDHRTTTRAAVPPIGRLLELLAKDRIPELEAELRRSAVAVGPRRFATEVAHPLAIAVGERWAEGKLSVRHEHLATECLVTQLRVMLASFQDVEGRPLVLLATLPGEPHTLALQIVALYLVAIGAKARLIGGSTPPAEIAASARTLRVDAVGVSVTPTASRKEMRRGLTLLRQKLPANIPLWIGGSGAEALEIDAKGTALVTSWDALDEVVATCLQGRQERRLV